MNSRTVRQLILPLDGSILSEAILLHGLVLANALDLQVLLVRVAEPFRSVPDYESMTPLSEMWEEKVSDYLARKADDLIGQGVQRVAWRELEGNPATSIINLAEHTPASFVAMMSMVL